MNDYAPYVEALLRTERALAAAQLEIETLKKERHQLNERIGRILDRIATTIANQEGQS